MTETLGIFKTVLIELDQKTMFDLALFYGARRNELRGILEEIVEEKQIIKWHLLIKVILEKGVILGEEVTYFNYSLFTRYLFQC